MSEASELLDLYEHAPLTELGALPTQNAAAGTRTTSSRTSWTATSNYTNVCVPTASSARSIAGRSTRKATLLSFEEIGRKIDEAKAIGAVQILLQGGHNPYIPFEWYLDLLRHIKTHHPFHVHGFSPSEVEFSPSGSG